jgi:hypothetical protein
VVWRWIIGCKSESSQHLLTDIFTHVPSVTPLPALVVVDGAVNAEGEVLEPPEVENDGSGAGDEEDETSLA